MGGRIEVGIYIAPESRTTGKGRGGGGESDHDGSRVSRGSVSLLPSLHRF